MKHFNHSLCLWHVVVVLLAAAGPALAVPTFQVYIDGAVAGNFGADVDTWLTGSGTFDLILVGVFGPNTDSLTDAVLVVSVPKGETGTLTVDALAPILTGADVDVLTNVGGLDAFSTKSDPPFPDTFNEHYPFKASVSNFILFPIPDFHDLGPVHDYNADTGTITVAGSGEEKTFPVTVSGFSTAHFDLFGLETETQGPNTTATWEINPGSHDAAYVPAPGALLLAGLGVSLVGWTRRRRLL